MRVCAHTSAPASVVPHVILTLLLLLLLLLLLCGFWCCGRQLADLFVQHRVRPCAAILKGCLASGRRIKIRLEAVVELKRKVVQDPAAFAVFPPELDDGILRTAGKSKKNGRTCATCT